MSTPKTQTVRVGRLKLRKKGLGAHRRPLHPGAADYKIADHLPAATGAVHDAARTWTMGPVLDQGQHGYCVGFGFTGDLLAMPMGETDAPAELGNRLAQDVYFHARTDTGQDPYSVPEGTTTESGATALRAFGLIDSYLWAHSIEDVRAALEVGPVIIAVNWYNGMDTTSAKTNQWHGLPTAADVSKWKTTMGSYSHCMCVTAYDPARPLKIDGTAKSVPAYYVRNSWGKSWGDYWYWVPRKGKRKRGPNRRLKMTTTGGAWMPATDLAWRLADYGWDNGAACMMAGRHPVDANRIILENPPPPQ